VIEIQDVSKRYRDRWAVRDLTVTVRPGRVTGFLGPNGSGKSTTMRMVVGLDAPTAGRVLVGGRRYADHDAPLTRVGALLDARGAHPGRTARAHLRALAATHRLGARRVDEVLAEVGLTEVAGRRTDSFSLGMSQRLGIAAALLGDPPVLLLDEPVNGLDTEGVIWVRGLLRRLAAEGRTVFVSSHLMGELAETADHVVVIGRGRLVADTSVSGLIDSVARPVVRVRTPDRDRLRDLLERYGTTVRTSASDLLAVEGVTVAEVGDLARQHDIGLHELGEERPSLEEAFVALTQDLVEYEAGRVVR
jgi:ABC-2 type transport system ATP-binding protein